MPPIVAILSLLLTGMICGPLAAQTFPAGNVSERDPRTASSAAAPTWPQPPAYAAPSAVPINDPQVRPAVFPQSPAARPATNPDAAEHATVGRASDYVPLSPPGRKNDASPAVAGHDRHAEGSGIPSPLTVAGSLAFVLGLFMLVAWVLRRTTPGVTALLPKEVVEVLGRAPLANRQQLHLLRCGHKLLLVSATPAGVETLTEITDPLEVDRLAGLCQQTRPDSATTMFRQVFQQLAETPRPAARRSLRQNHDAVELANAGIPGSASEEGEDRHG
jgi:flagellar biogenesis protein FliO